MEPPKYQGTWKVVLIFLAVLIAVVAFSLTMMPIHGEICHETNTGHENCATYNIVAVALWHIKEATNDFSPALAAVATIAIAWFTFSLRQSTDKLWSVSERQLEANNAASAAYVYPIIISAGAAAECITSATVYYVGDLTKDDVPVPETTELTFRIKNYGNTPAILKTAYVGYGAWPIDAEIGLTLSEPILGENEATNDLIAEMQIGLTRNQALHILSYTGNLCFSGQITFENVWGKEYVTRFLFSWEPVSKRMMLRQIETKESRQS